ncbi:MAG: type II toxin-antitoxin system VapC family toxin [Desulfobulbaceae bacterium]|jgi:predicted nucleic acid-binding protein|nr:type II toxin-antitoxin system VapC family toxin [Desulfobulbaceae bacterium]MDY0349777.1 type II toxin-antitoxin system VapC family toxin [Desulfobulbaceae bacterium]
MVIYWDASAILSILVEDEHSAKAVRIEKRKGIHLASSLCFAETYAVLQRMNHENVLTDVLYVSVLESLGNSVIRKINVQPDWKIFKELSVRYVLKGADLWHLAAVKTIQTELPEITILSFDKQLSSAAGKERISFPEKQKQSGSQMRGKYK